MKDENVPELPLALGAGKQGQGPVTSGATGTKLRIKSSLGTNEEEIGNPGRHFF
jgi:hypothetical protein